jgi:CDP-6-deoxy-D-xylo-4-hexulose-3-dehydrase
LLRQAAYRDIEKRVIGNLPNSDFVADRVFWIGVYPGLNSPMLDYMVESLGEMASVLAHG